MANVLQSRLITDSLGALPNVYNNNSYTNPDPVRRDPTVKNTTTDEDGNEVTTYTIPTYERTVIDIPDDYDWTQYGEAGNALRYFNQVRTGEIEYDPSKDKIDLGSLTETDPNAPPLTDEAELIKQEIIGVATQLAAGVGAQIGRSVADNIGDDGFQMGDLKTGFDDFKSNFNFGKMGGDIFGAPETGPASKVKFSPLSDNANALDLKKIIAEGNVSSADILLDKGAATKKVEAAKAAQIKLNNLGKATYKDGVIDRGSTGLFGGDGTAAGRSNLYGAAGAGMATVAANLIAGKNLKESVKTGAKVGVGTIVGTTIGGPIGGLIGGLLGGRVICNELMRQGIMTRKQVVLDYKFTEDYLTPQHVAGYHVWAVWMVKQMRKGRLVNFWTHVAGHRANEIAYIYGKRDKPDYLGKMYRKILEPICWSIGFFCQKTDWTVLYKEKEI